MSCYESNLTYHLRVRGWAEREIETVLTCVQAHAAACGKTPEDALGAPELLAVNLRDEWRREALRRPAEFGRRFQARVA
ncbi:MAG TPA: hypothetical protein GX743_03235 [Actinomycetales bacterium]|nr:hypothetical protein [Actinomycetales bacterium]